LLDDATVWADALTPAEARAHIGSPGGTVFQAPMELLHAA